MEQRYRFVFDHGLPPERLDLFLSGQLPEISRSYLKRLIDEGRVLLDDTPAKAGTRLRGGETIRVVLPPPEPLEVGPENIDLKILYEDSHLIVIDKPAGMVVHPAPGHHGGTLVNALLHHCTDLSGIGGALRPGIVHRLDKDTSGVMLATKEEQAHLNLSRQFKAHSITRRYVALVHGIVQTDEGTIDRMIGRHPTDRKKMSGRTRSGRRAVTHWRVLKRFDRDRLTWLELRLETGRTHQIRVHFSEMNLPIVGDPVYGNTGRLNAIGDTELRKRLQQLRRQALHARILGFIHPATGDYMEFESGLPEDMRSILDYLENKYTID